MVKASTLQATTQKLIRTCLPLVKSKSGKGKSRFNLRGTDNESMFLFLLYVLYSCSILVQEFYQNVENLEQVWNQLYLLFSEFVET
jgi:hypothetical protein